LASDISYIVSYRCPHCQAPLEGRAHRAGTWLRCPRCSRASLPPSSALSVAPPAPIEPGEDVLVIGPAPEPSPMTPVAVATGRNANPTPALPGNPPASPLRVIYSASLFVSVTMLLFSYLDRSVLGSSVFSALAILFLVLLLVPSKR
jgi:hypothetical protein